MEEQSYWFEALVILAIALVFYGIVTRWAHMIEKRTQMQRAKLYLDMKKAEKEGLSKKTLSDVANLADGKISVDFTEIFPVPKGEE